MATSTELIQMAGIGVGAMVALITVIAGLFIWTINFRDKSNYRQHQETRNRVDERYEETFDLVERRHREILEVVDRRHQEVLDVVDRRHQEVLDVVDRRHQEVLDVVDRRHYQTQEAMERMRQETLQMFEQSGEQNERRHQELLAAIRPLYHHVHGNDGKVMILAEEVAPAPAGN